MLKRLSTTAISVIGIIVAWCAFIAGVAALMVAVDRIPPSKDFMFSAGFFGAIIGTLLFFFAAVCATAGFCALIASSSRSSELDQLRCRLDAEIAPRSGTQPLFDERKPVSCKRTKAFIAVLGIIAVWCCFIAGMAGLMTTVDRVDPSNDFLFGVAYVGSIVVTVVLLLATFIGTAAFCTLFGWSPKTTVRT